MALTVENSGVKHYTKIIHITVLADLDFLCEVTLCVKVCHMCVAARKHGILWNCSDGGNTWVLGTQTNPPVLTVVLLTDGLF